MKANSKFDWRFINQDDYENILKLWWKNWGFPIPPIENLPKTGIMISKDGVDVYAGFIYYTGTALAWAEYFVSNKTVAVEYKRGALERLVDIMCIISKEKGVKCLFTSTVLDSFKNSLTKAGFQIGDVGNYQLVKPT